LLWEYASCRTWQLFPRDQLSLEILQLMAKFR
jgi:hypothetical protein